MYLWISRFVITARGVSTERRRVARTNTCGEAAFRIALLLGASHQ
jgi:hypothetical protein